jgi:hypothetical protein
MVPKQRGKGQSPCAALTEIRVPGDTRQERLESLLNTIKQHLNQLVQR